MYSIGEFSKITGLSIKALRIYHEHGILVPRQVNSENNYRWYDQANVERARAIALLRQMMISIDDIGEILKGTQDDGDAISFLTIHRAQIESKIREMTHVRDSLSRLIQDEEKARQLLSSNSYKIVEKAIPQIQIAGIRIKGVYSDSEKAFAKLGKSLGRLICGKAMNLFYDSEYKEEDADFESSYPVSKTVTGTDVNCRKLAGGHAVTLIHRGPYSTLGRSYARVFSHVRDKGYEPISPSREIYVKGPGMLFRGNPGRYLTEIQILVAA
jgi:DNA-binding transcriptional MerR regulator